MTDAIKSGPIRAFLGEQLPGATAEAARRRAALSAAPLLPLSPRASNQLIGTAVEYLIAGALGASAKRPACPPSGSALDSRALPAVVESARASLGGLRASGTGRGEVEQACRAALILAIVEHHGRPGRPVPSWVLAWQPTNPGPDGLDPATVNDLRRLAVVVRDDFADLQGADPLRFGPVLRSRAHLRGDCDIVASGLLLEVKTGASLRSVLSRDVLWQIALYALADTDDHWRVHSVGVAAVRWRTWILWPLDALLH